MTEVVSSSHSHARGARRRGSVGVAAAVAGVLGAMGVAGCGIQPSTMKVVGAAPTLQAANDVTGTQDASGGNQYVLYFFRGGKLTEAMRSTGDTVTQELILEQLIKGPSATESAAGYTSAIADDLNVVSTTANDQQWNYQYSQPLNMAEKAEIVCTIQQDLQATSVGTFTSESQIWNNCSDFSEDYGAPAYLGGFSSATATPSDTGSGD